MSVRDANGYNSEQGEFLDASEKTKEQWVIEGITYYKAKSYNQALLTCEQVIQLDPNDALGYYNKGLTLAKLKRYNEALDAYDYAIRLDPHDARIYCNKGNALAHLKRYKEALATFEQALQLDPSNKVTNRNICITKSRMFLLKAEALFKFKRYSEASEAYRQAFQFDQAIEAVYRDKVKALLDEGIGLLKLGHYNEAYISFEKAVLFGARQPNVDASLRDSLFKTANDLYNLKHYGLARIVRQAALIFSNDTNSYTSQDKTNRPQEATLFVQGERPVELKSRNGQTKHYDYTDHVKEYRAKIAFLLHEAKRHYEGRNYGLAGGVYKQLARLDTTYEDTYKDKGRDLLLNALDLYQFGRYEEAYDAYKQAIQFDPSNIRVSIVRGRSTEKLKHFARVYKGNNVLSSSQKDQYYGGKDEDSRTIDYNELIGEIYDGKGKSLYADNDIEAEVADPDEYDPYYNQYDGRDVGDIFGDFS